MLRAAGIRAMASQGGLAQLSAVVADEDDLAAWKRISHCRAVLGLHLSGKAAAAAVATIEKYSEWVDSG